jgi:DNA-binding XRE family transcriptional regulator
MRLRPMRSPGLQVLQPTKRRRHIFGRGRVLWRRSPRSAPRSWFAPRGPRANRPSRRRFSPTRLAAHRKSLGLSAAAYAQLVGVSALTIYKWEAGATRPRPAQLEAIATVRSLGKREAAARLAQAG